jgi:hypothetical protein
MAFPGAPVSPIPSSGGGLNNAPAAALGARIQAHKGASVITANIRERAVAGRVPSN